jgi:hypothetical protein
VHRRPRSWSIARSGRTGLIGTMLETLNWRAFSPIKPFRLIGKPAGQEQK